MTANDMHTRAMLVTLNIAGWSATKVDKEAAAETAKIYGAKADSGKYVKRLMPKGTNAYQALQSHLANMRVEHYAQTLAWSDDGWRLLTIKNYDKYTAMVRDGMHKADGLLSDLVDAYPALREQAIREATEEAVRTGNNKRLLTLGDFPFDIRGEYGWRIEYNPVPVATDFRVTLAESEIKAIMARTEERVTAAFADAQKDATKRLYDVVQKMQSKLSEPDAIFRDSLIGNTRELCDILTRLNVADDPQLETLRRQTELLAATEPQTLRDNSDVRIATASAAQSILDSMIATYGKQAIA